MPLGTKHRLNTVYQLDAVEKETSASVTSGLLSTPVVATLAVLSMSTRKQLLTTNSTCRGLLVGEPALDWCRKGISCAGVLLQADLFGPQWDISYHSFLLFSVSPQAAE